MKIIFSYNMYMKSLFKNINFTLLFTGALVSSIGTILFTFASGLYVQDLFNSVEYGSKGAFYFSTIVSVGIFSRVVCSPFSGVLIDRWNKVRILYMTDFLRAVMYFIMFVCVRLIINDYTLYYLFLMTAFLSGLFQSLFNPAMTSLLPEVVGPESLQKANGFNSIIGSVRSIFGVILGMFLYALVGIEMAILVNAISFLLSGISELFIRPQFPSVKQHHNNHLKEDLEQGFQYLLRQKGLRNVMIFSLILNFAFSPLFGIAIPYLMYTELDKTAYHLGIINISIALVTLIVGPVVGLKQITQISRMIKHSLIYLFTVFVLISLSIVIYTYWGFPFWLLYGSLILLTMLLTATLICINIPVNTGLVKSIDPDYRGRVLSIISALSGGALPVSYLLAGKLIEITNVGTVLMIYSGILVIPVVGLLINRNVREFILSFR